MTQADYLEFEKRSPFTLMSDLPVRLQVQKMLADGRVNYKASRRPLGMLHDHFNWGWKNSAHELILPNRPVKFFVDIDAVKERGIWSDSEEESQINRTIRVFSEKLGFSSDRDDWAVCQCVYPDHKKLSLHMILNDGSYFESAAHLKLFVMDKISADELKELYIDTNLWNGNSPVSMRICGSSKLTQDGYGPPFLIRGLDHKEVRASLFYNTLVQCVPMFGGRKIVVEGASQIANQREAFARTAAREEIQSEEIATFLHYIRTNFPEHGELEISNRRFDRTEGLTHFDLPFSGVCEHGSRISINVLCKTAVIRCGGNSCPDRLVGTTEQSNAYLKMAEYLKFLGKHSLCRVDMLLSRFSGVFGMRNMGNYDRTPQTLWAEIKEKSPKKCGCNWCSSDEPLPKEYCDWYRDPMSSGYFDFSFLDFLKNRFGKDCPMEASRDDPQCASMLNYCALFFNRVGDVWYQRTLAGIEAVKEKTVSDFFKQIYYTVEVEKGAGKNKKLVLEQKPFFPVFSSIGRFSHDRLTQGVFEIYGGAPLNLTDPKAADTEVCTKAWNSATPASKKFLAALLKGYLDMAVAYEPAETRVAIKNQLTRWILEVMFVVGHGTQMMPIFVSDGGGQGKSTLGYIIVECLGPLLSCIRKSTHVIGARFAQNVPFVFFEEFNPKEKDGPDIKALVTQRMVTVEPKFQKARTQYNVSNFFGGNNIKKFPKSMLATNHVERRFWFLMFKSPDEMDAENLFHYMCQECGIHGFNEYGVEVSCIHSFRTHSGMMGQFYTYILNSDATKKGILFDAFIGMLFQMYNTAKKTWKRPIAHEISLTKATREMQQTGDSVTGKWWRHCLKAGFHWCPGHGPRLGSVVYHREADLPRLAVETGVKFEKCVAANAFYMTFCQYCLDNHYKIIPQEEFMKEFDDISMAMRKISIFPLPYENLVKLVFKTQFGSETPNWVNMGEPTFKGPVIFLGNLEDWKDIQVGQAVIKNKRDDFLRSESNFGLSQADDEEDDPIAESPYNGSDDEGAGEFMQREDTRGVAIRGMQLKDLVRVTRDDDAANDGFFVPYQEDQEVDHDQQDKEARQYDKSRKRFRSAFIDDVAEVGEEASGSASEEPLGEDLEELISPQKKRQ